jgi:hypothetical protein
MARHAIGRSGKAALDEALALDPDAELASEAVTRLSNRPPMPVRRRRRSEGRAAGDETSRRRPLGAEP